MPFGYCTLHGLEQIMTIPNKKHPTSADFIGAEQALKRAAQRAREIAIQTNTPCVIRKDGKLVDAITNKPITW